MKKNIIIGTLILSIATCACVYAAEYVKYSSKFVKKFKDCERYQETIQSSFEGQNFTTTRKIDGWLNGFCRYQEVMSTSNEKYQIDCNFAEIQVDELYSAMKNRSRKPEKVEIDLFSKVTDEKTGKVKFVKSNSTTINGNKAYTTWTKYQNNPYFCMATKK